MPELEIALECAVGKGSVIKEQRHTEKRKRKGWRREEKRKNR